MSEPFILALAGGVGGGKLARGLAAVLPPERLAIAVNTADDFVHLGLHISPDIDSVLYALADLNDAERGWGLANETWNFMAALEDLGGETWFQLGDRDLATHVFRTSQIAAGRTLTEVTALLASRLGVAHAVMPMTDDPVRSIVVTDDGPLNFQEYFVRRQCRPWFRKIVLEGAEQAFPSVAFRSAIERAHAVVIAPSNPFVSIDPILAIPGVRQSLRQRRRPVVAVSPIVSGGAVKGPLAKMMLERGLEVSARTLARHYGKLVDAWVIDARDYALARSIEALGHRVLVTKTLMRTLDDKRGLAQDVLKLVSELSSVAVRA
jgi:LPPG:FO 2-phospho-L-lactate transferase